MIVLTFIACIGAQCEAQAWRTSGIGEARVPRGL